MAAAALTSTGFAQGTSYTGTGGSINDGVMDLDGFTTGPGTTSFFINVTDTALITNFNYVSLKNLTHTWASDLGNLLSA